MVFAKCFFKKILLFIFLLVTLYSKKQLLCDSLTAKYAQALIALYRLLITNIAEIATVGPVFICPVHFCLLLITFTLGPTWFELEIGGSVVVFSLDSTQM